jgi:GT2 family glycosyltransferase
MSRVTLIITSYNRFDLLEQTIDSFEKMNTYPLADKLIHEDSGNEKVAAKISDRFPSFRVISPEKQIGYSRSLDRLLEEVKTEYVFTSEDDWVYYRNPGFIERSIKILDENPMIHQVWIRDHDDHSHPLEPTVSISGIRVREVTYGYREFWNGFSLNPSLRRMSDLKRFFPNGISEIGDEIECAKHVAKFHYKAVAMDKSTIKHIGWKRRQPNFKI